MLCKCSSCARTLAKTSEIQAWIHRGAVRSACRLRKLQAPLASLWGRSAAGPTWATWSRTARQEGSAGSASSRSNSSWRRFNVAQAGPNSSRNGWSASCGPPATASAGTAPAPSRTAPTLTGRNRSRPQPAHRTGSAYPCLPDPAFHVELGVEVRRVRVAVLDPLAAEEARQNLYISCIEL